MNQNCKKMLKFRINPHNPNNNNLTNHKKRINTLSNPFSLDNLKPNKYKLIKNSKLKQSKTNNNSNNLLYNFKQKKSNKRSRVNNRKPKSNKNKNKNNKNLKNNNKSRSKSKMNNLVTLRKSLKSKEHQFLKPKQITPNKMKSYKKRFKLKVKNF